MDKFFSNIKADVAITLKEVPITLKADLFKSITACGNSATQFMQFCAHVNSVSQAHSLLHAKT